MYGNDYQETIVREIEEEIGIQIDPANLTCLGKILITLPSENEFWQVYRYDLQEDVEIKPNSDEVAETKWMTMDELHNMLVNPQIQWSTKVTQIFEKFLKVNAHN